MKIQIELNEYSERLFKELKEIIQLYDDSYENLNLEEFIKDYFSINNINENLSELIQSYKG